MINVSLFGKTSSGQIIHKYTIYNNRKEFVELLDYGASVHGINVKDKAGNISDVILGVKNAAELEQNSFEGITIGRCANRIGFGKCCIDGKDVQLECNMFGHFLHGASGNYGFKLFDAAIDESRNCVTFSRIDTGEGGFETNAEVSISFSFDDESVLSILYQITPDGTTIINPTNHMYFNLSGEDVREHILYVCSDQIVNRDQYGLPCGGTTSATGTPADFSEARTIKMAMDSDNGTYFSHLPKRFDEYYLLPDDHEICVARLSDNASGRCVEVYTDMECLVVFNGIAEKRTIGKGGRIYHDYCGVCLETQFVPNAINCKDYKMPVFHKGETFNSQTRYKFTVVNNSEV